MNTTRVLLPLGLQVPPKRGPTMRFFEIEIIKDSKSSGAAALDPGSWPRTPTDGVRVEKVRHDDDGHALAGGIAPTALFPEPPPPSEVALRATAATRPAFSGAPLVVLFVYISI